MSASGRMCTCSIGAGWRGKIAITIRRESWSAGNKLEIRWRLSSDEGLQFGGWALDDVCVVANIHSICGDGVLNVHEGCDEGAANADEPDRCRTYCQAPSCGDQIVDRGE